MTKYLNLLVFTSLSLSGALAQAQGLFDGGLIEGRCEDANDPLCVGDFSMEPSECEGQIEAQWDFRREIGPGADASVVNRNARRESRFAALAGAANVESTVRREQRLFSLMSQGHLGGVETRGGPWIKVMTVSRLDQDANHIDFNGLPFEGDVIPFLGPCMQQRTHEQEWVKHQCRMVMGSTQQAVCKVWKDGEIVATEAFVKTTRASLRRMRQARARARR